MAHRSVFIGHNARSLAVCGLLTLLPAGCAGDAPPSDSSQQPHREMEDPFGESATADDGAGPELEFATDAGRSWSGELGAATDTVPSSSGGWSIVVQTFAQDGHRSSAETFRAQFTADAGFAGAWLDSNDQRSIVRFGRYPAVDSPQAGTDLARVKAVTVASRQPYRGAWLAPVFAGPSQGRLPQFGLLKLRDLYPDIDPLYTLQIAFFEPEPGRERQAQIAAEQYVSQLRAQGETAFYYHGPNRSLVTVGVFFEEAVDPQIGYGPEVLALQRRHPYNLGNGYQIIERLIVRTGRTSETIQPSFLVLVPQR